MAFRSLLLWACALSLLPFQSARGAFITPDELCYESCDACLYPVPFDGSADPCSNPLRVKSYIYCMGTWCPTQHQLEASLKITNATCIEGGVPLPPYESVVPSQEFLNNVKRVTSAVITSKDTIDYPFVPDAAYYRRGYLTAAYFYGNLFWSYYFSWSLYGFWGLVLLVGMGNRAVEAFKNRRRSSYGTDKESRRYAPPSSFQARLWLWIRRSLILPATFSQHCQDPIGWSTLPPRLESILIGIYIVLNFVYCFPGYYTFKENIYWAEPRSQLARYISDRTGVLSIANVPLLWVFATRNDPFLWLTGWSFATYNRFHRWVARISTIQAVVHGIGYSVFSFYDGGAKEFNNSWSERYWWTGEIALIVMCFMLAASAYPLRNSHYDLFLVLHVCTALIFLITLYYHVWIFTGDYNGFIWPSVAIWSFDRFLRLARIIQSSVLPRLLKGTKAVVTYDKRTEMIRVDVSDFFASEKFKPGLFYYVYVPTSLPGWESHPFTLCSWRHKTLPSPAGSSAPSTTGEKSDEKYGEHTVQPVSVNEIPEGVRHSFLIRPYEGFTGRLRKRVVASEEPRSSYDVTILLEGPYGHKLDLRRFSDVLILCGGSGITAAVSQSHALLESTSKTSVHIVWALPQRQLVDDICEHELAAVINDERLSMTVYLTGGAVVESGALTLQSPYKVHFGRPDLYAVMAEARGQCIQDLAIVSCGTPAMADACRKTVVTLLRESGPTVEYFNETMVW